MNVVNSTTSNSIGLADNPIRTELNKGRVSNFGNLLDDQIKTIGLIQNENNPQSSKFISATMTIDIERPIDQISRLRAVYGLKDNQKYSGKTQKWQGYVIEKNKNGFKAKLEDLTSPGGTNEIVEIDNKQVSEDDKEMISLGAIFYLSAGYATINGQVERKSSLRFKRVSWTQDELDEAIDRAKILDQSIKWD